MAKRAAPDEKPYRPLLDADLVSAVIDQTGPESPPPSVSPRASHISAKVLEMPIQENPQRSERDALPISMPTNRTIDFPLHNAQSLALKVDIEKRVLFTRNEAAAIDRMVTSLAMRLQCQVKVSHVIRALVVLLLNSESQIDQRAGEAAPLARPPNGDAQAIQQFEREIAKIFAAAMRDAGPPR